MRTLLLSTLLLSVVLASALQTLNSNKELQETGFGRKRPHHGLRLLKWYVKTCLGKNMMSLCDPLKGTFGFHTFKNRGTLLPMLQSPERFGYFVIGNLRSPHAKDLPDYVKKDYDSKNRESNKDRVLVEYNKVEQRIGQIFISEHYKKEKTYIIGSKLLAFLRKPKSSFYIEM